MNQKLQNKMKSLEKEIEYLKHIEDSAIRDYNDLKLEYDKQVEEINSMDLTNKELKNRLDANKTHFDQEIERYAQAYESSKAESAKEIEYIKGEYENKLKKMKLEYNDLKQLTNEKDNEIRNLYQSMEQGNTNANQLENELNSYKRKYHDLEIKRNQDMQTLNQKIYQQEGNFQATRQAEISQLSQALERLESEKNAYANQIKEKEIELYNLKQLTTNEYDKLKKEKEEDWQNAKNIANQKYSELEEKTKRERRSRK